MDSGSSPLSSRVQVGHEGHCGAAVLEVEQLPVRSQCDSLMQTSLNLPSVEPKSPSDDFGL